jgi:hypothetical protein
MCHFEIQADGVQMFRVRWREAAEECPQSRAIECGKYMFNHEFTRPSPVLYRARRGHSTRFLL